MGDSPRMLELRRRVQADPASIAFAQLAEECRRAGSNEEAVEICRTGLARHPGYLSARVTLGRALIELGRLDAAKAELDIVVAGVPDNLAAIRGLAEILQRRGQMPEALQYYKRALELAKHDRDLEDTVVRISQAVSPAPPPPPAGPHVSIEEIFNFDKLIDQLGLPPEPPAPEPPAPVSEGGPASSAAAAEPSTSEDGPTPEEEPPVRLEQETSLEDFIPEILIAVPSGPSVSTASETPMIESAAEVELTLDDADSLAVMERELRELEQQRTQDEQRARVELAGRRRTTMVAALETWLAAIAADRARHTA